MVGDANHHEKQVQNGRLSEEHIYPEWVNTCEACGCVLFRHEGKLCTPCKDRESMI